MNARPHFKSLRGLNVRLLSVLEAASAKQMRRFAILHAWFHSKSHYAVTYMG
jgi:hypothetical protein